eukprot:3904124-Ditylum_brightwellii.AAC.1
MQYPSLGKGKRIDSALTAWLKDKPNSSNFENALSCLTHQSRPRGADRLSCQQLATSSKSQKRKEAKRPMHLA